MSEQQRCIFCHSQNSVGEISERDIYTFKCENCGPYKITEEVLNDLPNYSEIRNKEHLISGFIRETKESGLTLVSCQASSVG